MLRSLTAGRLPYYFHTFRKETLAIANSCYSLTAPMVRPVTRYLRMTNPRNIMGSVVTTPAAMICPTGCSAAAPARGGGRQGLGAAGADDGREEVSRSTRTGCTAPERRRTGGHQRQYGAKGLKPRGAVHHLRFLDGIGHIVEEALEDPDREGKVEGGVREDEAGKRAHEIECRGRSSRAAPSPPPQAPCGWK
jgi:hypothetical protein